MYSYLLLLVLILLAMMVVVVVVVAIVVVANGSTATVTAATATAITMTTMMLTMAVSLNICDPIHAAEHLLQHRPHDPLDPAIRGQVVRLRERCLPLLRFVPWRAHRRPHKIKSSRCR